MVDNAIMSESMALGFRGGPRFFTDIATMVNGQERRLQNRSIAIHDYTYAFSNKRRSEIADIKAFFMDRRGRFKSWLLKDWGDFQLTNEVIGTANGVTTTFQAIKTYTAGFNSYVRTIRHIKSGTAVAKVAGVTTSVSVGATGIITFSPAPSVGSITLSCDFYVPVRFDTDYFPITVDANTTVDIVSAADLTAIEVIP